MKNNGNIIADLRQDNSIDLYTITPKPREIEAYKKRILLGGPIYLSYLRSNNYETIEWFTKNREINIEKISYSKKISSKEDRYATYSEITETYYESDNKKRALIDAYFEGTFQSLEPKHLTLNSSNIEYEYLIDTSTSISININKFGQTYQKGTFLCLPKELYILQLLEANLISELQDVSIRKQAELFSIKQYKNISLESLKELCELGLLPIETYEDFLNRTKIDSKVLKKLLNTQKKSKN